MKEVEVKILEVNASEAIRRLKKMGARKVFDGFMQAHYYDDAKGRLKKSGTVLRLRQKGSLVELTTKKRINHKQAKVMDERQTHVDDFETMHQILLRLGFQIQKSIRKHRVSYRLDRDYFEFDTYPGIPTLLELESSSLQRIQKNLKKLGYTIKETKSWSSYDVLRFYDKD